MYLICCTVNQHFLIDWVSANLLAVPLYSCILAVWAMMHKPRRWLLLAGAALLNAFLVIAVIFGQFVAHVPVS
jgi:hypothetical protein